MPRHPRDFGPRGPRLPRTTDDDAHAAAPASFRETLGIYGNQVIPPPPPTGSALQREFDQALASQHNALLLQQWGNTQVMSGYVDVGATSPAGTPFIPFVNIGPFEEPRAIALECSVDPVFQMYFEYQIVVGIGQATATYNLSQLPAVLLCQQLQVLAKRADPGVLFPPQNVSIWAAPHVPRMGLPTPILQEMLTFGVGTGIAAITPGSGSPPRGATHVMVSADEVALNAVGTSTVWLRLSVRPFPETGSGGAVQVIYPMVSAQRADRTLPGLTATNVPIQVSAFPATVFPIPLGQITQWQWMRAETASAATHVVTWLRA